MLLEFFHYRDTLSLDELLPRMGDWVSYYVALLHGSDPSALPGVTSLKQALST